MDWFRKNLSSWRSEKSNAKTNKTVRSNSIYSGTCDGFEDFINITAETDVSENKILKGPLIEKDERIVENVTIFEPIEDQDLQKNSDNNSIATDNVQGSLSVSLSEKEIDNAIESTSDVLSPSLELDVDPSVDTQIELNSNSINTTETSSNPSPSSSKTHKYFHRPQPKKFINSNSHSYQQQEHFRNIVIQQPR